jgi:putative nucleotidyltransferase with HDIG domain
MPVKQRKLISTGAVILFGATLAGAVLSSRASDWHPAWLVIGLVAAASGGELVKARTSTMTISAGLTVAALGMALLGPAPAAAIMWIAATVEEMIANGPLMRGRRLSHLWNLGMLGVAVLAGALVIRGAIDAGISRNSPEFGAVVFGALAVTVLVNFTLAAAYFRIVNGIPVGKQYLQTLFPALPWLLTPNLVVVGLVMLYQQLGAPALVPVVALLGGFYVLTVELMRSREHGALLAERGRELASLQLGVLVAMVRTLSLRDKSTARHSAAVARYARAIAAASGYSEADQNAVHTAGLLHDIGKFAFPDRILLADSRLADEDWDLVRRHPVDGERLVSQIDGYQNIARIVRHHHERIDGRGYPDGLAGDAIPALSRMISVADIYDVITARDTYRDPVSREEAIAELRRSAGTQLDAQFVETFIGVLERKSLAFTHTEDSDFESELAMEQRIRELASPRQHGIEDAVPSETSNGNAAIPADAEGAERQRELLDAVPS